jgi:rhodanese-related sulfurtransferase
MLAKLFGGGGGAIDVAEAERRATAGEVVLIDVREKSEWKAGHAPMARHMPLGGLDERAFHELRKKGKPVAFICRSGSRSNAACGKARQAGLEAINVKGGMSAWSRAGLPVAR